MPPSDNTDVSRIDADDIALDSPIEGPDGDFVARRIAPDERVSTALVMAVGEVLDADPTALSPPLYEAIDAEALDRLFEQSAATRAGLRTEFEMYDCRIAIDGDRLHVRRIK